MDTTDMPKPKLHKCSNPLCDRLTTAAFCCGPCSSAFEGKYEIHESGPLGHTADCDKRYAERQKKEQSDGETRIH